MRLIIGKKKKTFFEAELNGFLAHYSSFHYVTLHKIATRWWCCITFS